VTSGPVVSQDHLLQIPDGETRPRTASLASRPGSSASVVSSRSTRTRTGSSASVSGPSSSHSRAGPSHVLPPLPVSRTVSPDLPDTHGEPTTPVRVAKTKTGLSVLGLGTPEVEQWIRAGKGDIEEKRDEKGKKKAKTVGFMDESESDEEEGLPDLDERKQNLAMQISPRRSTDVGAPVSTSWASTPFNPPVPSSGSPASGAHDLLRTIVRDVMYDFQRETKAEMMGLHLDLVRMGRGWKRELRDVMGEYVGDLKDLREENRRLREENERLRRGY
jgi:protein NEDD1